MIRRFRPQDEDAVIAVFLAATIPGQDFLPAEFWHGQVPEVRAELLPAAETWVVEDDGEVVAFVAVLGDLIGGLFTHPHHQGEGHGRALIAHVRARHHPLRVEVFRRNERAMAFYESIGFVEERSGMHEATGLEAVIMRLG